MKTDSTEKVLRLIDEIRQSDEITEDVKTRVAQVLMILIKKELMMRKLLHVKKQDKSEEEEKKDLELQAKKAVGLYQDRWKVDCILMKCSDLKHNIRKCSCYEWCRR